MTNALAILEINDSALKLTLGGDTVVSPGFALFADRWVAIGQDAQSRFRLRPLNGNNTFWQQVNLEPLTNASELIKHNGDLVYYHLKQLIADHQITQLLLTYPGFYNDEQLSLLLGICQNLPITVVGMVDSALLQACGHGEGQLFIVDQFLHHTLISEVHVDQRSAYKTSNQLISGTGQLSLSDALVQAISDEFIRQTRFNPLHNAEDEQILYNELNHWLDQLRQGESTLQVGDKSITIGSNILSQAAERLLTPAYKTLADLMQQHPHGRFILTDQSAWLTQWYEGLKSTALLALDHVAQQATVHAAQLVDEQATGAANGTVNNVLVTEQISQPQLATATKTETISSSKSAPSPNATSVTRPTHILVGHQAHPIGSQTLWLGLDTGEISQTQPQNSLGQITLDDENQVVFTPLAPCLLNGQPVDTRLTIQADNQLSADDIHYQFIKVMPHG